MTLTTPPQRTVQLTPLEHMIIGATPGLSWVMVGTPFDVIRTRMQVSSKAQFASSWHCLRSTVQTEGILALWKGLPPTLAVSLPFSTILFGGYQALRPETPGEDASAQEWRAFYQGVMLAGMCP